MPKRHKFFSGPWTLIADPPPCDPSMPGRALAYCEKARRGKRCTCVFDLESIVEDLEQVGLDEHAEAFEDELDADALRVLALRLYTLVRTRDGAAAARLQHELLLLRQLAEQGSGVRPAGE